MAGNWKMYKTAQQTREYLREFLPLVEAVEGREIVICPPFPSLPAAVEMTASSKVGIGGQNLHWAAEGAYTGEVSAQMLVAAGCAWVIIGHSERRQYFGETDENVRKKTEAAIEAGLTPIVCVGETLDQREAGLTEEVLLTQFAGGMKGLNPDHFARVTVACEPVRANGTATTATQEMAEEAHRLVRRTAALHYGGAAAAELRILYGGSVKPGNAPALMAKGDIDGVLVGGASLDAKDFAQIVKA